MIDFLSGFVAASNSLRASRLAEAPSTGGCSISDKAVAACYTVHETSIRNQIILYIAAAKL